MNMTGSPNDDETTIQAECVMGGVVSGNVLGALTAALDACGTDPSKRSVAAGVGCLKNFLAGAENGGRPNDDNDDDDDDDATAAAEAVAALDGIAAQLGLF